MPAAATSQAANPYLGDPDSWVQQHGDVLLRFAMTRVGDLATAEDLVQETLLAAWRARDSFDGACEPRTWFIAILRRRIADHFRRVGRRPLGPPTDAQAEASAAVAGADQSTEAAEFWSVVTGCTGEMPEHLARAFRLRTFQEEAPETICGSEGISRANLSVRLHRARQLLRRCLEAKWFREE